MPKLISRAIDAYTQRAFVLSAVVLQFLVVAFPVFALNYLQNIIQTYASERVATNPDPIGRQNRDPVLQQHREADALQL